MSLTLVEADMSVAVSSVLSAHGRLAAIEPNAADRVVLERVLDALVRGAGLSLGVIVDPLGEVACAVGMELGAELSSSLIISAVAGAIGKDALSSLFPEERDARTIPITADDKTLAFVLLPGPPAHPAGFASVVAHAASILSRLEMAGRVREADFELKYRVWELESLYDVGLSIAGTLDLESLADDILLKSVSLLNAQKGTLIVRDVHREDQILLKDFGGALCAKEDADALPKGMFRYNKRSDRLGPLVSSPAEKLMGVPIVSDGEHLGLLIVADKESRGGNVEDWNAKDERILSLFGNQAAIALENARLHREAVEKERMTRDIELAASIQKTILPDHVPDVAGLKLSGGNRPTRQVGGDYFDVISLPDGRVAFCVADVAGKGVPAALLVSTVHACIHLLVAGAAADLPAFVARINLHLIRFSAARKFVTLLFAVYDPTTGTLDYINAGHNPGVLVSASNGEITLLPSGGVPIGMIPNVVHKADSVKLSPGDLVVLYSDGITEAIDTLDEEFGMDRLIAILKDVRDEATADISSRIFAAVAEFTRGVAQYDDQTVLVARVT